MDGHFVFQEREREDREGGGRETMREGRDTEGEKEVIFVSLENN